jgi:hypothetical protein
VGKYVAARQITDDNVIRRMRFACWITNATHALRICNTYCFSTATMVTLKPLKCYLSLRLLLFQALLDRVMLVPFMLNIPASTLGSETKTITMETFRGFPLPPNANVWTVF